MATELDALSNMQEWAAAHACYKFSMADDIIRRPKSYPTNGRNAKPTKQKLYVTSSSRDASTPESVAP